MTEIATQSNSNLRRGNPAWGNKKAGTGRSGNPTGAKPKEKILTHYVDIELDRVPTMEEDGIDGKGKTYGQLLVEKAFREALGGSYKHLEEIWKRTEGPVSLIVGGTDHPIEITFREVKGEKDE